MVVLNITAQLAQTHKLDSMLTLIISSGLVLVIYMFIVALLVMWNNETPTPLTNKGKNGVGKW